MLGRRFQQPQTFPLFLGNTVFLEENPLTHWLLSPLLCINHCYKLGTVSMETITADTMLGWCYQRPMRGRNFSAYCLHAISINTENMNDYNAYISPTLLLLIPNVTSLSSSDCCPLFILHCLLFFTWLHTIILKRVVSIC